MAKQRKTLVDMSRIAAAVKEKAENPSQTENWRLVGDMRDQKPPAVIATGDMTTTAVHLPKATLALLRRVAVERANQRGGRPSVSAVLVELVERQRAELEAELRRTD